ncbi:MAG: hypothetical protein H0W36_05375 [Gemmatimonadetes bacterium]|nr:hypothetical protein [Gemmatimonadota bacterium]
MSPEFQPLVDAYQVTRPSLMAVLPVFVLTLFGLLVLVADLFELDTTRGPAEGEDGTSIMAPHLALLGTLLALGAVGWQALRLDRIEGPISTARSSWTDSGSSSPRSSWLARC